MAFVFYDLETSGTNTRFDQILQFAAVRTDTDLVEQERVELSCRLDGHVVPHPEALAITRRTLAQVTNPDLPSHYSMMCDLARLLEGWSPAAFVGFISIRFDEEMLRHALYRTLHNPYLTSMPGNMRADALTLARGLAFFTPGCITVPTDAEGKPRFKLHLLNEANGGPPIAAHTAIGDVDAMIALCRLIQRDDPSSWSRFLQFASKKSVAALLDQGGAFGLVRFLGNEPRPCAATQIGRSADANLRYCFDLLSDLEGIALADDDEIAAIVSSTSSPIVRVRVNACPCVCEVWDLPDEVRGGLGDADLQARAERVSNDPRLGERLLATVVAAETPYGRPEHVEAQLYDSLPNREDDERLQRFHAAPWSDRQLILDDMVDGRWRYLGSRLIYLEAPHTIDPLRLERMHSAVRERRSVAVGTKPWTSLHDAIAWFDAPGSRYPPGLALEFADLVSAAGG